MRYGIRQMVLGANRFVQLTAEEYRACKSARQHLLVALQIEQKFRMLLSNYAEFEEEILRITNRDAVFNNSSWNSMHDDLYEISRRLINLLSTARLYIDQVKHDISSLYGNPSTQLADAKSAFSKVYDKYLGYRAMEALRNYAQHQSLPIHAIRFHSCLVNGMANSLVENNCTPAISIEMIEASGEFKATVLDELRLMVDRKREADLKPLIREYLTGLGSV